MHISHPIRLGVALNLSVLYTEIMKEPKKGWKLAKDTFETAVNSIDEMKDDDYKDSAVVLQVLKDNISLWNSEFGEDEEYIDEDEIVDI